MVRDAPGKPGEREVAGVDWIFNAWGGDDGGLYKPWCALPAWPQQTRAPALASARLCARSRSACSGTVTGIRALTAACALVQGQ